MTSTDRQSAAGAALLEWMNSFSISGDVGSLNNLNDGQKIWEVLCDIEPKYFKGSLPEGPSSSRKWDLRWANLKHVSKKLSYYLTNECHQTIPKGPGAADLKIIAMGGNRGETIKLLKIVVFAALNCANRGDHIQRMQTLTFETQKSLKDMIEGMQPVSNPNSATENSRGDGVISPTSSAIDQELILEEKLGKVMAENAKLLREKKELQKDNQDLNGRLAHLQESNAALQDQLAEAQDRLKSSDSITKAHEESRLQELKLRDQNSLIANLEDQLRDYQTKYESIQKTHENLRKSHERSQPLRDELREVKLERDSIQVERDSLLKKANAAEKYKLKLQANQHLDKENESLREELEVIRLQLKEADQTQQYAPGLHKQVREYEEILPQLEQDRHELQIVKVQLEVDKDILVQRLEEANTKQARDQEVIAELEYRCRGLESPHTSDNGNFRGLEAELEDNERHEIIDKKLQVTVSIMKWSRLTFVSRNKDLRDKNETLSNSLVELDAKCAALQKIVNDSNGKYQHLKTVGVIEAAMAGREEMSVIKGKISLEEHVGDLISAIAEGRDDLAKKTEVQRSLSYNRFKEISLSTYSGYLPIKLSLDMFRA